MNTKMLKLTIVIGIIYSVVLKVSSNGDIGKGEWYVINVRECENPEAYDIKCHVQQVKLNRSHDCFNAKLMIEQPIDDGFGVKIDMCKKVDGGCKPFQNLADDCFIKFVEKYASSNMEKALTLAGVDPPKLPLPKGNYCMNEFLLNYCEMPEEGIYGSFGIRVKLTKNIQDMSCLDVDAEFRDTSNKCNFAGDDE